MTLPLILTIADGEPVETPSRACRQLHARGAVEIDLQVEVENDNAIGLYLATGFRPVSIEDYCRLPCA